MELTRVPGGGQLWLWCWAGALSWARRAAGRAVGWRPSGPGATWTRLVSLHSEQAALSLLWEPLSAHGALRFGWLLAVSSGAARPCGLTEQGPPSARPLPSVPMQG